MFLFPFRGPTQAAQAPSPPFGSEALLIIKRIDILYLTLRQIARAKAMLASGYYTQAEVADMFNVSPTTLRKYLN